MGPFTVDFLDGKEIVHSDRRFYDQFFDAPVSSVVLANSEMSLTREKTPGTFRIFVFGGSAALGWPNPTYQFSRILKAMLQIRFPEVEFDVINLAYGGLNSHIMRELAEGCSSMNPDLFIVYMGNNEYLGPYGVMNPSFWARVAPLRYVQLQRHIHNLRIYQLLSGTMKKTGTLLGSDKAIPSPAPDSAEVTKVHVSFAGNLADMCESAQKGGVPILLSTVGVNIREWAPVEHDYLRKLSEEDEKEWQSLLKTGSLLEQEGKCREAQAIYQQGLSIYDKSPTLFFRMGQCAWQLEDYDAARESFTRELELDGFVWARARPKINEIIRETAERFSHQGVYLVDVEKWLADRSPHGIPGQEFFIDNCHFTLEGSYEVALAFYQQIEAIIGPRFRGRSETVPPSLKKCAQLLAWDKRDLIASLQSLSNHLSGDKQQAGKAFHAALGALLEEEDSHSTKSDQEDRLGILRGALEELGPDYLLQCAYVGALTEQGHGAVALKEAYRLADRYPGRHMGLFLLAQALAKNELPLDAMHAFGNLLRLYSDDKEGWIAYATLWASNGTDEQETDRLISLLQNFYDQSNAPATHRCLGLLYAKNGRFKNAFDEFGAVGDPADMLRIAEDISRSYGIVNARKIYRGMIRLYPENKEIPEKITNSYLAEEDMEGLLREWLTIADEHPNWGIGQFYLGAAYERNAMYHEALDAFKHSLELQPDLQEAREAMGRILSELKHREES